MNRIISFLIIFLCLCTFSTRAQVELGLKAGMNASRSLFDDEVTKQFTTSKFKIGYFGGIVAVFNNKKNEKYAMQAELAYARVGRRIKNTEKQKPNITINNAFYDYLQLPIMFRMRFKQPRFNWYLQLGPQVSYWFGGRGTIGIFDTNRQLINEHDYTINFGEEKEESNVMNVSKHNEFQLGLVVGAGVLLEPNDADRFMVSLRYHFGHSYMGEEDGGYIPRLGFFDNFEATNQSIELAVAYTFDLYEKIKIIKKEMQ